MSIHPSLSSVSKSHLSRSVLKRIERIKDLIKSGRWRQGDSVFGLPKTKTVRIKIKKEKPKEKAETQEAPSESETPAT